MAGERVWLAFVAMPFSKDHKWVFSDVIKPALTRAGYQVERADSKLDQRNILQQIVEGIVSADLMVVDLSTRNGNVMYELGIAHALRIPTIMIMNEGEERPFDVTQYVINSYSRDYEAKAKLEEILESIARDHTLGAAKFGNPVVNFAPHLAVTGLGKDDPLGVFESDDQEPPQLLDLIVEFPEVSGQLTQRTATISKQMLEVATYVATTNSRIMQFGVSPGVTFSKRVHDSYKDMSARLTRFANFVRTEMPEYRRDLSRFVVYATGFTELASELGPAQSPELTDFLGQIEILIDAVKVARSGISGATTSLGSVPRNFTRHLNAAVNRGEDALRMWDDELGEFERQLQLIMSAIKPRT